jgi:G-protein alpha subunit
VTAMIFVASLSDYDQLLLDSTSQPGEEKAVNRMEESFALFDVVVKERFLQTASIILFLNKTDVFQEKIQKKDLEDFFPDYARFHLKNENVICSPKKDSAAAIQFILSKYAEVIRKHAESGFGCDFKKRTNSTDSEQEHMLYSHLTCATDKENMKFITAAVEDHILRSAVSEINLL